MTGQVTKFGAFLDSSVDRYSDFFLVGGLALHFARTGQNGALVLSLGVILGSFCVSYTKARAENFIPHCGVGLFDRGLRIVLLLLGTLITPLLKPILWILLLGSHATAIQRILHTRNALAKPLEEPGA
jgi:CDP-diacylglycerol--glycerol-3-phosphate 3-phosphatidyltransferase